MKVLVINCGSSSIKYQLFEMPEEKVLAKGLLEKIGEETSPLTHQAKGESFKTKEAIPDHKKGLRFILDVLLDKENGVIGDIKEISAVGHRVVHGGEKFTGSVLITKEVRDTIEEYADLAPLHNPPNLVGIDASMELFPGVPQVACFDTAFHQTIPEEAYIYAVPYELYEKYKIRRYGFHGTSHRYVARRAAGLLGKDKYDVNLITCHLGNGCSITAVKGGKSIDTSMGLTPLEGVAMGTRSGDIDPAITFHLMERLGMKPEEIDTLLNKKSGLLGVSGVSNDMRDVHEAAVSGNKRAALAIDIFSYRIKKYIGAYMAVLGKVDAVVFTGGIGENATFIREKVCTGLEELGISLDIKKNQDARGKEAFINTENSKVKILVIPTNEEGRIAHDTYEMAKGNKENDSRRKIVNNIKPPNY